MLLEEVGNRGSHFGGGMFYWRLPDPFCADPPGSLIPSLPQVNINVWPLCRWLLPLPHTSVDKNPLATQYVEGQGRKRRRRSRRRSSYSQEVLVNYYYILFFHGKDSEVGAATKSEVEGVNQSLAVICKSGLSTSSVWVCVYVCLTYFSMLTFELTIRKKKWQSDFFPLLLTVTLLFFLIYVSLQHQPKNQVFQAKIFQASLSCSRTQYNCSNSTIQHLHFF